MEKLIFIELVIDDINKSVGMSELIFNNMRHNIVQLLEDTKDLRTKL